MPWFAEFVGGVTLRTSIIEALGPFAAMQVKNKNKKEKWSCTSRHNPPRARRSFYRLIHRLNQWAQSVLPGQFFSEFGLAQL